MDVTVKQLKEMLAVMPDDATVRYVWDGDARSTVRHVWMARCGDVILSDDDDVYSEENRPFGVEGSDVLEWETIRRT